MFSHPFYLGFLKVQLGGAGSPPMFFSNVLCLGCYAVLLRELLQGAQNVWMSENRSAVGSNSHNPRPQDEMSSM